MFIQFEQISMFLVKIYIYSFIVTSNVTSNKTCIHTYSSICIVVVQGVLFSYYSILFCSCSVQIVQKSFAIYAKRLRHVSFWYKMMVIFISCSTLLMKSSTRNSIHWSLPVEGTRRGLCRRGLYNIYIITFNKIRKSPLAIYTIWKYWSFN